MGPIGICRGEDAQAEPLPRKPEQPHSQKCQKGDECMYNLEGKIKGKQSLGLSIFMENLFFLDLNEEYSYNYSSEKYCQQ